MNNITRVIEGILDNRHCEAECCANIDAVHAYSESCEDENGNQIQLTNTEAEIVMIYCKYVLEKEEKEAQ